MAMLEAACMLLAAALLATGFALLAWSQERHCETLFGSAADLHPRRVRRLRALGAASIAAALPVCIGAEGAGFGSLLWVVLMGACAMAIALLLTWRPQWLRALLRG
jgi:hypothetical protein